MQELLLGTQPASAAQLDIEWIGGTAGVWSDPNNWLDQNLVNQVPDNNASDTFNVLIGGTSAATVTIDLDINASVDNVTFDAEDTQLVINDGRTLSVAEQIDLFGNDSIVIDGATQETTLLGTGLNLDFHQSGSVRMNGEFASIAMSDPNATIVVGTMSTLPFIAGAGMLGDGSANIHNGRVLFGDHPLGTNGPPLMIRPTSFVNNEGTINASGGIVELHAGLYDQTVDQDPSRGGTRQIRAQLDGVMRLMNGVEVLGGQIARSTSPGDTARVEIIGDVKLTGVNGLDPQDGRNLLLIGITVTDGSSVTLKNKIQLGALQESVFSNGRTANTDVILDGDVEIAPASGLFPGIWRMGDSTFNRWRGKTGSEILTLSAPNGIVGPGQLGMNQMGIINHAAIEPAHLFEPFPTNPLIIDPADVDVDGAGADVLNTGALRGVFGGTLQLTSGVYNNTSGIIEAWADSTTVIGAAARIEGGVIRSIDGGIVKLDSNTALVSNVTFAQGTIVIDNGIDPQLAGTITNNATVLQNSTGNLTDMVLQGNVTLEGSGIWAMSDDTANGWRGSPFTAVLTNGVDHTIRGAGQLGKNQLGIDNRGTVDATATNTLTIDPSNVDLDGGGADVRNTGTLKASVGGLLVLTSGEYNNSGGTILAENGSTVIVGGGATVIGGEVNSSGSGVVQLGSNSARLTDATHSSGTIVIDDGIDPQLAGAFTNHATVRQNGAGSLTDTVIQGNVTLAGNGEWVMSDDASNGWRGSPSSSVLTQESNHAIRGAGQFGKNLLGIINRGTIEADGSALLTIDPSNADVDGNGTDMLNEGTLHASGAGGMQLNTGVYRNASGGSLIIDPTSSMTLLGGTFTQEASSSFIQHGDFTINNGATFNNLDDDFGPGASAGEITLKGTFNNDSNGTLLMEIGGLAAGSQYDLISGTGTMNLGGDLALQLIAAFLPDPDDSFTIVSVNSLTGAFDNVADGGRIDTLDGVGSFQVNYSSVTDEIVLTGFIVTVLPGDFDLDLDVDGFDFLLWQRDPGVGSLSDWQANFGTRVGPPSAVATKVPEPSSVFIAAWASFLGLLTLPKRKALSRKISRRGTSPRFGPAETGRLARSG